MKRKIYLFFALFLFVIEVAIALFVKDRFIRPYFGDVLVVVLVYCAIRVVFPRGKRYLFLAVFLFAVTVELLQLIPLSSLLGGGTFVSIVLGTSFSWLDILCYACGTALIFPTDALAEKLEKSLKSHQ